MQGEEFRDSSNGETRQAQQVKGDSYCILHGSYNNNNILSKFYYYVFEDGFTLLNKLMQVASTTTDQ